MTSTLQLAPDSDPVDFDEGNKDISPFQLQTPVFRSVTQPEETCQHHEDGCGDAALSKRRRQNRTA